ncbi:MAG: electron transfer flavoprotein subunit alpha/FixB family protein [Rhodobacteraceae bacterium]|nr:electron transfer flavoprotein subunit alpha/FixB family protein [Paracoccaceae bacterium]
MRHRADAAPVILVVPDLDAGRLARAGAEVLGAARHLAGTADAAIMAAFLLAPGEGLRFDPAAAGIDRLAVLQDARLADGLAPPRVAALAALAAATGARHILFAEGEAGGGLGRRLAARLGERPATGVVRIEGGAAVSLAPGGRELRRPLPRVLIVAGDVFAPLPPAGARGEARPVSAPDWTAGPGEARDLGLLPADSARLPLAEAHLVVAGGAGLADWGAFHALAAALGAAEAGSRPACDAGHLPRDRQIGASGAVVAPRAYVALGISGARQHLDGIAACPRVIAVNTDPHCEMLKRADLAIVGDAAAVARALVRRLREGG